MYATYGKGDAVNSVYCTVFIRRVECAAGHVHTERDLRHVRMSHVAFKQCLSATQFMHLCCLCFIAGSETDMLVCLLHFIAAGSYGGGNGGGRGKQGSQRE